MNGWHLAFVLAHILAGAASAQCALQLVPTGQGIPGVNYTVTCTAMWDPDGAGPQPPRLVLGGQFGLAGNQLVQNAAAFEPTAGQWEPLGWLSSWPSALVVLPNGTLVAGGSFQLGTECLMQWNGSAWVPFGGGGNPSGRVVCLAVAANGDLVAVVDYYVTSYVSTVYRRVGGAWQTLGAAAGPSYPGIYSLLALPNSDLVVGGRFATIGGVPAGGIARWNGTSWSPFGTGTQGNVSALALLPNGDLVAGGFFTAIGGSAAANVAQWNGTTWTALGSGTAATGTGSEDVRALMTLPNGDLVAGGGFGVAGGIAVRKVARWNGTAWSALGAGIEPDPTTGSASLTAVNTLHALPNGDLVAGGYFQTASGRDAISVARFDGVSWGPLRAMGIGKPTTAVAYTQAGHLVLGGRFRDIDGIAANGVALWNGTAWSTLGTGLQLPGLAETAVANDVFVRSNGDIVVGGDFATAGGVAAAGIARWDGASWHALGTGLTGAAGARPIVTGLAETPGGDLIVGGSFATAGGVAANHIARWNGSSWSALGGGLTGFANVAHVAALANGHVLAVTGLNQNTLELWNASTWQTIGAAGTIGFGSNYRVHALLALPNGDALVGGDFLRINGLDFFRIARWSNGTWLPVGGGFGSTTSSDSVQALAALPNGDVIAGGYVPLSGLSSIARWNGTTWSPFVNAVASGTEDLAVDPRGEIAYAGSFFTAGGALSAYLARIRAPCPATAMVAGAGCTGSGGPNVLAAASLPWLGTILKATATGMPAASVAVAVYGFGTASTPLASILPQGGPGCFQLVTLDHLVTYTTGAGSFVTSLPIPNVQALAGLPVHHQVVTFEFSALGAITALTATNRLELTLGAF